MPQSWNRYGYALGDPVNNTDASGLDLFACDDGEDDCSWLTGGAATWGWFEVSSDPNSGAWLLNNATNYDSVTVTDSAPSQVDATLIALNAVTSALPGDLSTPINMAAGTYYGAEQFYSGFGNMILNNDPRGALQVGGSLLPAAVGGAVGGLAGSATGSVATETYFRTMTTEDYAALLNTGQVAASGETFISPSLQYASKFNGVTVQFDVQAGTFDSLYAIGVRSSWLTAEPYGSLPVVQSGWGLNNAYFKLEGPVNIGLGRGPALNIFNGNIINYTLIQQ